MTAKDPVLARRRLLSRIASAVLAVGFGGLIAYLFADAVQGRSEARTGEDERMAIANKQLEAKACQSLQPTPVSAKLGKLPVRAPDFEAEDVNGKSIHLSAYRGKIVFLNYWAPWCPPCQEEAPSMESMASQLAADPAFKDVEIVAVAHEESWKKIRAFFPNGTKMTVVRDRSGAAGAIGKAWGTNQIPDSYLIDRDGNVRFWFENQRDWGSATSLACLRSLVEEKH